jgi:tRNA dimethylallyltransferase
MDREWLYERINRRVSTLVSNGLVNEVAGLLRRGYTKDTPAMKAIGYKEIVTDLRGDCSLRDAVDELKLSSRRYAKRQLTWFRHEEDAVRLYVDTESGKMKSKDQLTEESLAAARMLLSR